MLQRIFPKQFDNRYQGHRLGLWIFYPITLLNVVISLVAVFKPDGGAQSADGIPLDTFGAGGAEAVIHVVALLGLASVLLYGMFVLALVRYRAMIPLIYVLTVADWVCHKAISAMKPIAHVAAAPGGVVTFALIALSVIGLVLSLTGKGYAHEGAAA